LQLPVTDRVAQHAPSVANTNAATPISVD